MDAWVWILLAALVLIAAGIIWYGVRTSRTHRLEGQYGSEYDRTLARTGDRRSAEADLRTRRERVDELDLQPLSQADHDRYASRWTQVQSDFVDQPAEAVSDADRLIQQVMASRGYPVQDFDRRAADLSVSHPEVVENYRSAHSIAVKEAHEGTAANTEALRKAMVYYRSLFDELLVADDGEDRRN